MVYLLQRTALIRLRRRHFASREVGGNFKCTTCSDCVMRYGMVVLLHRRESINSILVLLSDHQLRGILSRLPPADKLERRQFRQCDNFMSFLADQ